MTARMLEKAPDSRSINPKFLYASLQQTIMLSKIKNNRENNTNLLLSLFLFYCVNFVIIKKSFYVPVKLIVKHFYVKMITFTLWYLLQMRWYHRINVINLSEIQEPFISFTDRYTPRPRPINRLNCL